MNPFTLTIVGIVLAPFGLMPQARTGGSTSSYPLSSVDREIDPLGAEEHIKSEQDARAVIELS
jgi:hypothetical protein